MGRDRYVKGGRREVMCRRRFLFYFHAILYFAIK
jgi:hypothetical protein